MPKNLTSFTSFDPIRNSIHGLFANSRHGQLHIWADKNAIYVDVVSLKCGDVCLACLTPSEEGITIEVYGDHTSAKPTYSFLFDNLGSIFEFDNIDYDSLFIGLKQNEVEEDRK